MVCLIYTPSALGPAALRLQTYISGKTPLPVLQLYNNVYDSGGHPKPQDCQDVGGGHPKPHRDHSEEQSEEQITSLDRTELCVSCNEKADDNTFECQWCSH